MPASLVGLPPEILEHVADHLDLADLRSLRLVCHEASNKITPSNSFTSFCSRKNVNLRVADMQRLVTQLSKPGVHTYLEHLTLTGVLVITKGLERVIREKTKPADIGDPCRRRRDELGNQRGQPRERATQAEVEDAEVQLRDFRRQIRGDEEQKMAGRDLEALVDLFQAIRTHCRAAGLASLTLDLVVYREKTTALSPAMGAKWREVWTVTEHVLSASLHAWSRSVISIAHLDIFSKTAACGVQSYHIACLQKQINFRCLHGLESLSLSISNRAEPVDPYAQTFDADEDEEDPIGRRKRMRRERDSQPRDPQAIQARREEGEARLRDPANFTGIGDWLRQTPNIQRLDLRNNELNYNYDYDSSPAGEDTRKKTFAHITSTAPLTDLRTLSLHYTVIGASSLLTLVRTSPRLRSLDLREVTLVASNGQGWAEVFAHLTSPASELTRIYLDNLFESGRWHSYVACHVPGFEPGDDAGSGEKAEARVQRLGLTHWDFCRPAAKGINAFESGRREEVLRGVEYRANGGFVMGSVQNNMWMEQRRRLYTPPGRA